MRRLAPLLCLLLCGCSYLFPDPRGGEVTPRPDDSTIVVPSPADCPGFSASRQQAADRAATWGEICDRVKSGEITTVSQVASYSLKADRENADRFNADVQSWLEAKLGGSDDKLPDGSLAVFEELRDSFGRAAK